MGIISALMKWLVVFFFCFFMYLIWAEKKVGCTTENNMKSTFVWDLMVSGLFDQALSIQDLCPNDSVWPIRSDLIWGIFSAFGLWHFSTSDVCDKNKKTATKAGKGRQSAVNVAYTTFLGPPSWSLVRTLNIFRGVTERHYI